MRSIDSQPSHSTGRSPHARSTASGSSAAGRRASSGASSISEATVSLAQDRFEPITPVGPRLIHPATYSPGEGTPSRRTRPAACGTVPRTGSKGRPGSSTPR